MFVCHKMEISLLFYKIIKINEYFLIEGYTIVPLIQNLLHFLWLEGLLSRQEIHKKTRFYLSGSSDLNLEQVKHVLLCH